MIERWTSVDGYEDLYEISNYGQIRCLSTRYHGHILKMEIDRDKYYVVRLVKHGIRTTMAIHRMVFEHFKESLLPGEIVHHIDENKLNNKANNLMKMTVGEHRALHNKGSVSPLYINLKQFQS